MTPYGTPLTKFNSFVELISALKDIILVHQACIAANILHGDVSLNNIILIERDSDQGEIQEGYLIDFDWASMYSSDDLRGERTGTLPFMSIELLFKTPIQSSGNPDQVCHCAKHDLFYVLLYISTVFRGTRQRLQSAQLLEIHSSVPVLEWVDPEAYSKGCLKMGHMADFEC